MKKMGKQLIVEPVIVEPIEIVTISKNLIHRNIQEELEKYFNNLSNV